jgi:hypothetical protein
MDSGVSWSRLYGWWKFEFSFDGFGSARMGVRLGTRVRQ